MNPVSLSEIVGRELFITTTARTPIHLRVQQLNNEEASLYTFLDVVIVGIPEGLGYTLEASAQLYIARRDDKTLTDIIRVGVSAILPHTTSDIAPGYFCLLNQDGQYRAFHIQNMEIR